MAKKKASKKSSSSGKINSKSKISQSLAIVCLLINILIIPGLGSLIGGRKKEGIWQLILLFGGVFLGILLIITVIGLLPGLILLIGGPISAWIWGIVTGVDLIKNSK